jgi:hypothetical protein
MNNFDNIQHPRQRAFLQAFARTCHIGRASEIAGVDRSTHYTWLNASNDYRKAFEDAREMAVDVLSDEAVRRAAGGVYRKVFNRGDPVIDPATGEQHCEVQFSDQLLMFVLRGLKPEVFRERSQVEVNGGMDYAEISSNPAREIASQNTAFLERAKILMAAQRKKALEANNQTIDEK